MKKLFLVLLILLAAGVGVFFIGRTPDVPVVVRIIGMTNAAEGRGKIFISLSNQTTQPKAVNIGLQHLFAGIWFQADEEISPVAFRKTLPAHSEISGFVYCLRYTDPMRLEVSYALRKTPRQMAIDDLLERIRLGPRYEENKWRKFTTPPFDLLQH
jgi:hypothetical protein